LREEIRRSGWRERRTHKTHERESVSISTCLRRENGGEIGLRSGEEDSDPIYFLLPASSRSSSTMP
jgi:hypothetical protein